MAKSNKVAAPSDSPMDNWQAESDARTLVDAENIKADAGRHQAALGHAQKQSAALQNVISAPAVKTPAAKPMAKPAVKTPAKISVKPTLGKGGKK